MRLIEVLLDAKAKRFSRPPLLTYEERKKYFKIEKLNLSPEATKYYAQWASKAKITQIAEIVELQIGVTFAPRIKDVASQNLTSFGKIRSELTKIIMRSESSERERLLEHITNASILTWQHVNLHGTYDFSNLFSSNDPEYTLDDVINFKAA